MVRKFEPSPFSRRGPGSNFIIKPEVVDFGGNLDVRGDFNELGVYSLDENIKQGEHLELYDFPYPESLLRGGKWFGKISMTLAYDPPLDPNFGQEYCRVNINASLGTYERSKEDGKLNYSRKVPLEKRWDDKFERSRVENGFKWSPIKSYHREMPRGIKDNNWKLRVDFLNRNEDETESQRFVLIITIVDPEGEDIYTDVINQLRLNGFTFGDLKLDQQVRQQFEV